MPNSDTTNDMIQKSKGKQKETIKTVQRSSKKLRQHSTPVPLIVEPMLSLAIVNTAAAVVTGGKGSVDVNAAIEDARAAEERERPTHIEASSVCIADAAIQSNPIPMADRQHTAHILPTCRLVDCPGYQSTDYQGGRYESAGSSQLPITPGPWARGYGVPHNYQCYPEYQQTNNYSGQQYGRSNYQNPQYNSYGTQYNQHRVRF
ncbi:hypothetical protein WN51_04753 [Melipona quadrifasciata]|uniref:Uncharacterized protein n=1 Tax=Melipona quadrifasciata TaxID=166423 RepID=A0A0M8ZSP4_9HYME|nr:hypothetical protein WN51_04753 [Melipona quadrifasciata]